MYLAILNQYVICVVRIKSGANTVSNCYIPNDGVLRTSESFMVSGDEIIFYANLNVLPKQYPIGEAPVQPVVTNQEPVHASLTLEAVTPAGVRTTYSIVNGTGSASGG